jgi:hypothetical protein
MRLLRRDGPFCLLALAAAGRSRDQGIISLAVQRLAGQAFAIDSSGVPCDSCTAFSVTVK